MYRMYLLIIAALVALVIYLVAGQRANGPEPSDSSADGPQTVAVFQFVAVGKDGDAEKLAAALSERVGDALSTADGVIVAARNLSLPGRGPTSTAIRELGVRYFLEGSLATHDDSVCVTAQLVDNETDAHLWSHTYERDIADHSNVSDEIAREVIATLRTQ